MQRLFIAIAAMWLLSNPAAVYAQTQPAPGANPGEAEIEAVLGEQTAVKRSSPGHYVIDGQDVTVADLLGRILPERLSTLNSLRENIRQRTQIASAADSGMTIDAKRIQCQKLAPNSVDRTRCYQELVALREHQNQSSQQSQDEAQDDRDQADKLDRQIEAINQFRQQYGIATGGLPGVGPYNATR